MRNPKFWDWFDGYAAQRLVNGPFKIWASRATTFRAMFEHLDKLDRPVTIVETGSLESRENWHGNGCSSLQFDCYVKERGDSSQFVSIDLNPINVELTRSMMTSDRSRVICGDSVKVLDQLARDFSIDLLYLDGSHLYWHHPIPSQQHHLNELTAIMPALHGGTLVVVDDSPSLLDDFPRLHIGGKGALVAKYALGVGADFVFHEYQAGWVKMTNRPEPKIEDIRELVVRAREHVDARRLIQADGLYLAILGLTGAGQPQSRMAHRARAEACVFFAQNAQDRERWGTAKEWYEDALQVCPDDVDARTLLVKVLRKLGMHQAAIGQAKRATQIKPEDHFAWKSLGDSHAVLADHTEHDRSANVAACIAAYEKEGELAPPDYIDWKLDLCGILSDQEQYDRVEQLCDEMMGTPNEPDAWHVLGLVYARRKNFERSIECFDKAVTLKARDQAQVHWNRGISLHAVGRYREGWVDHEWRILVTHNPVIAAAIRRFNEPKWNKQPPPLVIHVHGEGGAGDNIAMARYLKLLVDEGYTVRFEALAYMEKLIRDSFPDVEVVPYAADYPGGYGLKPFDYHAPTGSLPAIYGTDIDTVPWFGPYIKADPKLVAQYDLALDKINARGYRTVGLCWSSGVRLDQGVWLERYGRKKSMHFDRLAPLLIEVRDSVWFNLQVGPERAQAKDRIMDLLPEKEPVDWAETAALVANLDLVITVDTSIAHLAGAMGKPVWLMMHTEGSWHWMVERPGSSWNERSPWYPSVRIFRAKRPGEWAPVIERITAELKEEPKLAAAE
jgi:tetratricopeptide (TPR) repeat protein